MTKVTPDDDARFERDYAKSLRAVEAVAHHLKATGNKVEIVCAAEFVNRADYTDPGADIFVWRPKRVEVKHRNLDFTCMEDFPYPTIIIDRETKTDALCDLYVSVNRSLTHAAFISINTKDAWHQGTVADHKKGYGTVPVLLCPKEAATFVALKTEDGE